MNLVGFPLSVLSCFSEVLLFFYPSGSPISCFNSFLPLTICLLVFPPPLGQVPLPWKAHWHDNPAPHFQVWGRHEGPMQDGGCLRVAFCPAKGTGELLHNAFLWQPRSSGGLWQARFLPCGIFPYIGACFCLAFSGKLQNYFACPHPQRSLPGLPSVVLIFVLAPISFPSDSSLSPSSRLSPFTHIFYFSPWRNGYMWEVCVWRGEGGIPDSKQGTFRATSRTRNRGAPGTQPARGIRATRTGSASKRPGVGRADWLIGNQSAGEAGRGRGRARIPERTQLKLKAQVCPGASISRAIFATTRSPFTPQLRALPLHPRRSAAPLTLQRGRDSTSPTIHKMVIKRVNEGGAGS